MIMFMFIRSTLRPLIYDTLVFWIVISRCSTRWDSRPRQKSSRPSKLKLGLKFANLEQRRDGFMEQEREFLRSGFLK